MSSKEHRAIPPPPSFSTAPDMNDSTGFAVPSFSSAPDLSELADDESRKKERKHKKHKREQTTEKKERGRHRQRSRSSEKQHSFSHHRRRRSRTPEKHSSRRRRSRTPEKQSSSRRRRSRSPESRSRHRTRSPHSRSSKRPRSRERRSRRSPSPIPLTGELKTGIRYIVDKRGDKDNLTYGGLHSYDVPSYHREGGGYVIGLSSSVKIDKASATSGRTLQIIASRLSRKKKLLRYTDAAYTWKETDKDMKRLRIRPGSNIGTEKDINFIRIDGGETPRKDENDQVISSGVDYRSIEGPNATEPAGSDDDEQSTEEGESFDEYIRRRTVELNRKVDKDRHDVEAWMEFIAFQDEAAQGLNVGADGKFRSKANKSSLNEVKMAIFEKALEANPSDETLLSAYLACGEEIWDTLTLLQHWDKALKARPESIRLWADYINLRQTNFSSFSFSQCVKVFEDCISTLNKLARRLQGVRKNEDNLEARENIESVMVYVLLRACLFMKQAGYHERGFGTLQAVVEFTLFPPRIFSMSLDITFEDMLAEFSDFWDSEVLRFGEKGAKGWKEYYRTKYEDVVGENTESPEPEDVEDVYSLVDWVRLEESKERNSRLPMKMKNAPPELVDEDPYVITLSDDIREFLFNITTGEARQGLIYSIFVFLGLPFTPPGVGTNTHFCVDTFTHNELKLDGFWPSTKQQLRGSLLLTYIDGIPMESERVTSDRQPYDYPVSYPVGTTELFARYDHWFSCVANCHVDNQLEADFTRNAFQQLLALKWTNHLAVCYISFESSYANKSARRVAKTLLKDRQTNVTLWNAYAQMEKSHGKLKEARKVYQTALAAYRSFPNEDQVMVPLVYSAFAQLEWEEGRSDEALKILVACGTDESYDEKGPTPSSAQLLRAQRFYAQKTSQLSQLTAGTENEMDAAYHYIICYALFQLLTQDINEASNEFEHALEYIQERHAERGFESELLWVAYAKLTFQNVAMNRRAGYKPGHLRHLLNRALILFPNNTVFIGLYVWNEAKTKLYNRVRSMFAKSLESDPNVILWLSSIRTELHYHEPYDVNQVRSLFESSIEKTNTRSSILLWKLYIEHEIQCGELVRAKSLFYRAIRACPWSKEICLLGIRLLSRQLSEKELHEIVSLMMEKEIRLRQPIDDRLLVDNEGDRLDIDTEDEEAAALM
ncbi:NRDE-2, necessary for RNA interference-domain-containing protein [Zychaea mexicana]|uniref:NRDE-2, necessary for RNA interference-domain-containing protein n=1 Tax=Zychaea mexicana TaxID=64656 RepID=UPI0022FF0F93|nr:NRDE-2, necessary for RNA interference-domain-containing protein [Zychaea mexicana]KAI9489261.1 NRDE-2, necessary for RNA interference-domain-containing protein [Zychaea mexicana]